MSDLIKHIFRAKLWLNLIFNSCWLDLDPHMYIKIKLISKIKIEVRYFNSVSDADLIGSRIRWKADRIRNYVFNTAKGAI